MTPPPLHHLFQEFEGHPGARAQVAGNAQLAAILDLQTQKIDKLADTLNNACGQISKLAAAFPNEDPEAHRRYHEKLIANVEARRAFWEKLLFELVKYGLIGFLGWTLMAVWSSALKGPK